MSVTNATTSVHNAATPIEMLCINTIRTLSMDAVQAAVSGHPGTPMSMAPLVYCLWQEFLRSDPADPIWPNRDRFVLSAGHASMLLYSILHLTGVREAGKNLEILDSPAIPLEDIKNFRQLGSRIPSDIRCRGNDGPARPGCCQQRWHGYRGALAGLAL